MFRVRYQAGSHCFVLMKQRELLNRIRQSLDKPDAHQVAWQGGSAVAASSVAATTGERSSRKSAA